MARKPQVRFYASCKGGGGYFVTVAGRLHELALGPDDAPQARRTSPPSGGSARCRSSVGSSHHAGLFTRIEKKRKRAEVTAYSYRHTYATELLDAGTGVATPAHLMGNSPVVRLHYSHLPADMKG